MGLIARAKNWVFEEVITFAALNAEFNNILNNLIASKIDDHSANVAQMQETQDPGDVGTEVLPESVAEELKSIRSMLTKVTGEPQWYSPPSTSLLAIKGITGLTTFDNRIISGITDNNNQPQYLIADGLTLNLQIKGATTDLKYAVAGIELSLTTDKIQVVANGLPANNTALASGAQSDTQGEDVGAFITLNTVESEIVGLTDKRAAFKHTVGPDTEYFIATVRNAGTELHDCRRGFFFDSLGVGERLALANGTVVELLRLSWIFIKNDNTFIQTTDEPFVSSTTPVGAAGNMWFDLQNNIWKFHNGVSFIDSLAVFLGYSVQDDGVCEGTRSIDFFASFSPICDIGIKKLSDTKVHSIRRGGTVGINGNNVSYQHTELVWDFSTDLDTGNIAANKSYFAYIKDNFEVQLSLTKPYDRMEDLKGFYHPHKPFRALALIKTGGASTVTTVESFGSSSYIADRSLSGDKLGDASIDQKKLIDSNIPSTKFIDNDIPGTKLLNLSVARDKLVFSPANIVFSQVVDFSTADTSFVAITNLNVTIVTEGNPVVIGFIGSDSGTDLSSSWIIIRANDSASAAIAFTRDGGTIGIEWMKTLASGVANVELAISPNSFMLIDVVAAGSHDYVMQIKNGIGGSSPLATCKNIIMFVYELKS